MIIVSVPISSGVGLFILQHQQAEVTSVKTYGEHTSSGSASCLLYLILDGSHSTNSSLEAGPGGEGLQAAVALHLDMEVAKSRFDAHTMTSL